MSGRPILCEEPPAIQFRGENVLLTLDDDRHPDIAVPVHVMLCWCESTLIEINQWLAERAARNVVVLLEQPGAH